MTITLLSKIMPSPTNPIDADGSWVHVEEVLGVKLPDDFKDFIRVYGSGTINHFISVLSPFSKRPTLNLLDQSKRQLDVLRELHDDFGEKNQYALYPAPGGLLPVAMTDNGDVIHWLTSGGPADWTIVVNESRSADYQRFGCNLTTFLEGVLNRTMVSRAFPGSVFDGKPSFDPT
jgi:SMI1-KNR4 cell-wall